MVDPLLSSSRRLPPPPPPHALHLVWETPRADDAAGPSPGPAPAVGLAFCCGGRVLLPPRGLAARGGLLAALALLVLAAAAFSCVAALGAAAALGAGATAGAGALLLAAGVALLRVAGGDPGVLPRHVSALRGLAGAALAPPAGAQLLSVSASAPVAEASADSLRAAPPLVAASAALAALAAPGGGGGGASAAAAASAATLVKFCVTCRIWRPPGAHHCSRCNVCVAGFDHHCDFIGKCVGSGNARAFLLMLWLLVVASAACLAYVAAAALLAVMRAAAAGAGFAGERERPLWACGGGLLGAAALAAALLPATCASNALARALGLGGLGATGAAFASAAGPAAAAAALPALLATLLFSQLLALVVGLAVSFSCTFAAQRTTKAELAAAAHARNAAAAAPSAGASPRALPSLSARFASLLRILATPAPPRMVDFAADVSELAAAVRAFEKAAYLRAKAASQLDSASAAAAPPPPAAEAPPPVVDWRSLEALRRSVDSNYLDDALAIGEACAAVARRVPGVLVGSRFLLPGVELLPAPPSPF